MAAVSHDVTVMSTCRQCIVSGCFSPHGLKVLHKMVCCCFLGSSHDCCLSPQGLELSSKRKKMEWQLDSEDECEDDLEKTLELRQVDARLFVCVCSLIRIPVYGYSHKCVERLVCVCFIYPCRRV